jgi:hypothetical protein
MFHGATVKSFARLMSTGGGDALVVRRTRIFDALLTMRAKLLAVE